MRWRAVALNTLPPDKKLMRGFRKALVFDYNFPMPALSRRDFLKLGGLSLGTLAFSPSIRFLAGFDDSNLVRVATKSVSVYGKPDDTSPIVSTWYRDELLNVYDEVVVKAPAQNPVWYRVWGGFVHRARLQRVKILYNETMTTLAEGLPRLVEVTVPYTVRRFRRQASSFPHKEKV